MFMSFSLHNSLKMHVHYFHFTGELSWIQKSYYIPKYVANKSQRWGSYKSLSEYKVCALYTTRSISCMYSTAPQIKSVLQLLDCVSIGLEMGTCEET